MQRISLTSPKSPVSPVAYWVSESIFHLFKKSTLGDLFEVRQGMTTSDNNRFLRFWYEVGINNELFNCENAETAKRSGKRWFPYNKGGEFRKWYGNRDYVVNYYQNGIEMEQFHAELNKTSSGGRMKSREFYFRRAITWSFISSSHFCVRYSPPGAIFDVAGSSMFPDEKSIVYCTGYLCSAVANSILEIFNPTMNYQAKDIKALPIVFESVDEINKITEECISLSKTDWDSYETSWDFKRNPLV